MEENIIITIITFRTDFVAKLTHRVKGASPSDVLMVKQEMTTDSSGNTGCVSATLRTFGGSCKPIIKYLYYITNILFS